HPMRDGTHGGLYVSATRGDDTPIVASAPVWDCGRRRRFEGRGEAVTKASKLTGRSLCGAVCLLALVSATHAGPNSKARVRAFASLPDWTGIWQSSAWPLDVSGRVAGGEGQLRQQLQLLQPPPYNPLWKAEYEQGMKDSAALAARAAAF